MLKEYVPAGLAAALSPWKRSDIVYVINDADDAILLASASTKGMASRESSSVVEGIHVQIDNGATRGTWRAVTSFSVGSNAGGSVGGARWILRSAWIALLETVDEPLMLDRAMFRAKWFVMVEFATKEGAPFEHRASHEQASSAEEARASYAARGQVADRIDGPFDSEQAAINHLPYDYNASFRKRVAQLRAESIA